MKVYRMLFTHLFWALLFKITVAQEQPLTLHRIKPPSMKTDIHAGVQDPQGYMWFATDDGLYRYDGYHYTYYVDDPLNSNSLVSHHIETLYAGRNGMIWVGTQQGLGCLDPSTGSFTHFFHEQKESSLSDNEVKAICEDHEGIIWVGTNKGLNRLDPSTKIITRLLHSASDPKTISDDQIRVIYEDKQGMLWIGTGSAFGENYGTPPFNGGLNRFDRKTRTFIRYLHDPADLNSLADSRVRAIFEDSRGTFWIGTAGDGLHTMDREKGTFTRYSYDPAHPEKLSRPAQKKIDERIDEWADDHITFITEDVTGCIWIGTFGNGINRYDPVTKKVTHLSNIEEEIGNTKIDAPFWACSSKDGVLWIGYFENLYNVDLLQTNIPYVSTGDIVYCIYEDTSGVLWYGGEAGLVRKDPVKKTTEHFMHDPDDPRSLSSTAVASIYEDRQGVLWVGTSTGLTRFNKKDRSFTRFKSNLQIHQNEFYLSIEDVFEDSRDKFWIATADEGLKQMDRQTGAVLHYPYDTNDSNSTSTKRIRRIYEDRSGNLWIGTLGGGLNRLTKTGKFQYFLYRSDINDILEDFQGVLWVATSKGLYRKDQSSDKFEHFVYPGTQMTSDIVINGMLEDTQGSLWMNSAIGILELNRLRDGLVIYGESHGVNSETSGQFAYGGCYKSQSGQLFFGVGNGYYSFFPGKLSRNTRPPQILIHQFRLGGNIINPSRNGPLKKSLADTKEIRLRYDQNFFSFDFTAIHYSNPAENKHLFMLEGLDESWHIAGDQKTANYTKVPPGKYTFRVKASNSDGIWVEKSIAVIVLPPWWHTWWAYLLYGFAFVTGVLLFTWYRSSRLKQENLHLEEKINQRTVELERSLQERYELSKKIESQQALLSERLRISRELHDDIGSTLGSISIYSEVAKKRNAKNENTNEVLSKIGLASRELIDKMSDIVWSLNPNSESFEQLQNRMMAFAAMMLAPRNIVYDFSADEEIKTIQLTGEQRKNIFLIFKEALYNIVKYANCKNVHIALSGQKNSLVMIIRDNGNGFVVSQITGDATPGNGANLGGNGIKNMRARADDMNAKLNIDSKINEGTTIQLTLSRQNSDRVILPNVVIGRSR